jgi:hypothetical protein
MSIAIHPSGADLGLARPMLSLNSRSLTTPDDPEGFTDDFGHEVESIDVG